MNLKGLPKRSRWHQGCIIHEYRLQFLFFVVRNVTLNKTNILNWFVHICILMCSSGNDLWFEISAQTRTFRGWQKPAHKWFCLKVKYNITPQPLKISLQKHVLLTVLEYSFPQPYCCRQVCTEDSTAKCKCNI